MIYKEKIIQILDGWFGEPLEHSEDEDNRRKHLYEPILKVLKAAELSSYANGVRDELYSHD